MPEPRFPILGADGVPPMLGRAAAVEKIIRALTRPAPGNIQVVGPRFAGKTVILHEVARRLANGAAPYTAVLIWDLGHQTPETNSLFMQRLSRELARAIAGRYGDFAAALRNAGENPYQDIRDVLDLIGEEGGKILAILDGFDRPLSNGQLTRTLWDQLRDLALRPSLRLVTSSRRTLRELIRHPDAQTSDFWNIFDPTPVRVGCFDDADVTDVLHSAAELALDAGARTELANATNGYPVMMLEVLNTLCANGAARRIDAGAMKRACEETLPVLHDKLDALWSDCQPSSQDLLRRVLDEGPISRAGLPTADVDTLVERGFVQQHGDTLQRPSRLMRRFLEGQANEVCALARLFGTPDAFEYHFKGVLERRIAQVADMDPTLRRYLERAADDLPDDTKVFMTNIRGIIDHAFDLIWAAELPAARRLPSAWMDIWKRNREPKIEEWETTFPQGARRLHLLKLMTGSERSVACAQRVSKGTYLLLNAIYSFGEFGQHQEGGKTDVTTAYAVLHLCIELAVCVTRDLGARQGG